MRGPMVVRQFLFCGSAVEDRYTIKSVPSESKADLRGIGGGTKASNPMNNSMASFFVGIKRKKMGGKRAIPAILE